MFRAKKKVAKPSPVKDVLDVKNVPNVSNGPICDICGEAVAPGQSSVCAKHIRIG